MFEGKGQKRREQKRREGSLSSGFLFHKDEKEKKGKTREMTGLSQKEQESPEKFSQTFHKENAYGHIAFGANKKSETGLVISGKQEYHDRLARENERNLESGRAKRQDKNIQGEIKTSTLEEQESAFALFSGRQTTENQMLLKLKEYERTKGNAQLEKQLPFLSLEKDREEKVRLTSLWQEAREQGLMERARELELAGLRLSAQITQKEQQEKQFRQELRDQLREFREHPEKDREDMEWRLWKKAGQVLKEEEEKKDGTEDETGTEGMDEAAAAREKDLFSGKSSSAAKEGQR